MKKGTVRRTSIAGPVFLLYGSVRELDLHVVRGRDLLYIGSSCSHHRAVELLWNLTLDRHLRLLHNTEQITCDNYYVIVFVVMPNCICYSQVLVTNCIHHILPLPNVKGGNRIFI